MGFVATSKTKIRNTILLLDEQPNYNSGHLQGGSIYDQNKVIPYSCPSSSDYTIHGCQLISPNALKYEIKIPEYLQNVSLVIVKVENIVGYADDAGYLIYDNHSFDIGGRYNKCTFTATNVYPLDCFNHIEYSPLLVTDCDITSFFKVGNIKLNFESRSHGGFAHLIISSFKLNLIYVTK